MPASSTGGVQNGWSTSDFLSTAAAIGPAVGGWARDTMGSFEAVFYLCAVAGGVMLVATVLMKPPRLSTAPSVGLPQVGS